ncbi:hypothetical protein SDC9_98500 [bioreactor metagenome]|uniref:Uncharacterized protein n=1 Tax=bioreactor metagenome TaxID=1076179 RepID=A0A645AEZ8_9ZZZZ
MAAHVGQRIPLRGVLQINLRVVVAHHVRVVRVFLRQREVQTRPQRASRWFNHRGKPPRVERVAARQIQGQTQAKALARPDFSGRLQYFLRRQIVQAPHLIIGAKVTPVRQRRPVNPAWLSAISGDRWNMRRMQRTVCLHLWLLKTDKQEGQRIARLRSCVQCPIDQCTDFETRGRK